MDSNYESLEKLLKPTKKHRGVLLVFFLCLSVVQVITTYNLYKSVDRAINIDGMGSSKLLTCMDISLKIRYAIVVIGLIGVFHTRITPWTICTSLCFIAYGINMISRFYVIYKLGGAWQRLKSISLLFYELETNLLCFTFSLLFVYQSFYIHSEDKVSLDMEDPKKSFVTRLVKSLLSIVPGLGFFRRKIFSVAKLD